MLVGSRTVEGSEAPRTDGVLEREKGGELGAGWSGLESGVAQIDEEDDLDGAWSADEGSLDTNSVDTNASAASSQPKRRRRKDPRKTISFIFGRLLLPFLLTILLSPPSAEEIS